MIDVDRLWSGWRLAYVESTADEAATADPDDCPFCSITSLGDEESLILERGEHAYSVLNLYPYNSAHSLVLPYRHVGEYEDLTEHELGEINGLAQRVVRATKAEYAPDGFNLGANLGRAAGAGIPKHFHFHVLPRWSGDTNFITVLGATKTLPEEIDKTHERLYGRLAEMA